MNPTVARNNNPYEELRVIFANQNSPPSVYVQGQGGKFLCPCVYKDGMHIGNRDIFKFDDDSNFVIPQIDCADKVSSVKARWPKIVEDEVTISHFANSVGLLGLVAKKTEVFPKPYSSVALPGYKVASLESLKSTQTFVICNKFKDKSTWKRKFFNLSNKNDTTQKEWDALIKPLRSDIAKLIHYKIPYSLDFLNIAIVDQRNSRPETIRPYAARYFDFNHPADPSFDAKMLEQTRKKSCFSCGLINKIILYIKYYFDVFCYYIGLDSKLKEIDDIFSGCIDLLAYSELGHKGSAFDTMKEGVLFRYDSRDILWESLNIVD